ncbi:hypothetical protein NQ318_010086 [Aromia moschata]|uniref:Uncharacterized protein n=1 Tax=Aromia moschata TaxID=1265417 RepID=A0AAV8YAT2_9CUCU|nr:hypothetical protein NQ318_010086 [Aromia moschata]
MLLMVDLPDDEIIIRDLLKVCDLIRDDVRDKTVVNNVVKFVTALNNKLPNNIPVIEERSEGEDCEEVEYEVFSDLGEGSRNI